MSNIYLKVAIQKNGYSQNFEFISLKNSSPGQFFLKSDAWMRKYVWLFYSFKFEEIFEKEFF